MCIRDRATETIGDETVLLGKKIKDAPRPIESFEEEEKYVAIEGRIIGLDVRELRNGKQALTFKITDEKDSISCKVIKTADEIKMCIRDSYWLYRYANIASCRRISRPF